ncbi:unannotated protein [freshwater metagenome]|uniref:Unannotated protein n=1 Tax=freshwater metagenome TaxID=449393 RepID=A0A6J6JAD8_9ZZZZ
MEGRDRIDHLHGLTFSTNARNCFGKRDRIEPFIIHGHMHHIALISAEDAKGTDIRRSFYQHYIAWITKHTSDKVQSHLRASGHNDVVGVGRDFDFGHHIKNLFAQKNIALTGPVLQGNSTTLEEELGNRFSHHLHVEGLHKGHAAGK